MRVTVIDYKAGNLTSVLKALRHLGAETEVTDGDPAPVETAERIVLPGVGHFAATQRLDATGLTPAIRAAIARGVPFLGICVGMQWLYAGSSEAPDQPGLAHFAEQCTRFPESHEKVPHVGWNSLEVRAARDCSQASSRASLSTSRTPTKRRSPADTAAITQYIEPFAAAVERGNVMGVQFHPEKSGDNRAEDSSQFSRVEEGNCMLTKRIIACLDVHDGRVVKGVQFVDLIDAGDPATQAARHAREGADEIVLLDITATHEGRQTLLDTVRRTARELFVPFRGGRRHSHADDAAQVFEAGADKVSVNSAALADPTLIDAIGRSFGAQAVVVAIDARRDPEAADPVRDAQVFVQGGRKPGRSPRGRVGARG